MNQARSQPYKERRFGVLLVILLVLVAGPSISVGFGRSALWLDGLMSILMLAAIVSLCFEPLQRIFALLFGIPSILFSLGSHLLPAANATWPLFLGHLCEVTFLFCSAVLIVKSLFGSRSISFDSILGAVCGYLFLGLGWAVIYSMIESYHPGSFKFDQSLVPLGEAARPLSEIWTYYSFVTLTTVGFGDVVPISSGTRTCAWLEAITGQFYLAVIVAGLVSLLVSRNSRMNETAHGGSD